jgi:hypothetical protein
VSASEKSLKADAEGVHLEQPTVTPELRTLSAVGRNASIAVGRDALGNVILTGLQSAFTYTGATRCEQFLAQSVVGVQTAGGYHEGTPYGGEA